MSSGQKLDRLWFGVILAYLCAGATPSFAKKHPLKAHIHGAGKVDIATQDKTISVEIKVPAEDIFGFEHVAKSKAEKQKEDEALATLRQKPLELFGLDPSLGCQPTKVEVATHADGHHVEVEGAYRFECQQPFKGQSLKIFLFKAFPRIKTLDVQVISESGQQALKVTSAKSEIAL